MDMFNYINVILEYLTSKYKYFKNIFFCIIINILPKHLLHVECVTPSTLSTHYSHSTLARSLPFK